MDTDAPTPEQLAEARDRAAKLGLTVRGRKNFVLDDGKDREQCGDFISLMFRIEWREAIATGQPTYTLSPCGSHGLMFMNDKEGTAFKIFRQEDGDVTIDGAQYKKGDGLKTDLETGEAITFDVLEDGTHKETRRFPKEDDDEDENAEPSAQVLTLVRRIKALIEKGDRATEKAEQFYKSAGIHIKEIKEQSEDWETIIREQCGLGRSRAYELMAIADGRTTLEKVRASTNDRKKVHRAKSDPASVPERTDVIADIADGVMGDACLMRMIAEEATKQRVTQSREISADERRAQNAALDAEAEPTPPEPELIAEGESERRQESEVADPAEIEDDVLYTIARINEHAELFHKVFKASSFDREAKTRINTAIDTMIQKWRSTQAALGAAS